MLRNPRPPAFSVPGYRTIKCESAHSDLQRCEAIRATALWAREKKLPQVPLLEEHGRTAILACYGPSLKDTLEELRADAPYCDIYTVSGAHDVLLDAGIRVDGHIEADPREHKGFFLTRPQPNTSYMLASACYEGLYLQLEGFDVNIWHVSNSPKETVLIEQCWPGAFMTLGTNVGTSAISLLSALGYRRFITHAMDCSFSAPPSILNVETGKLTREMSAEIGFHAGDHPNEDQQPYRVWVGPRPFITSPQLMQAAQDFISLKSQRPGYRFEFKGDGMLKCLVGAMDRGEELITPGRTGNARLTLQVPLPPC